MSQIAPVHRWHVGMPLAFAPTLHPVQQQPTAKSGSAVTARQSEQQPQPTHRGFGSCAAVGQHSSQMVLSQRLQAFSVVQGQNFCSHLAQSCQSSSTS